MKRDRCDYRVMSPMALTTLALEEGLDPEMAIAIAEKLRRVIAPFEEVRGFFFKEDK